MRSTILPLAWLAGTILLAAAPAATAGDRDGADGRPGCNCDCGCRQSEDVRLPDSFFYDNGGVGPAFVDYGSSSGAETIVFEGARTSASASASAQAAASARAFASARVQARQGMMRSHTSYKHGW
ncbi:MAG TPA: hypothetical protein VN805_16965 [Caulobacteraceae bacterium]|nr:hypothetical protein [Caulobacteraceae bacterium]